MIAGLQIVIDNNLPLSMREHLKPQITGEMDRRMTDEMWRSTGGQFYEQISDLLCSQLMDYIDEVC